MRHSFYSYSEINCNLSRKRRFYTIILPLSDIALEKQCIELCEKQNLPWKDVNAISNEYIVHKHTLRIEQKSSLNETNNYKRKQR